MNETEELIDHWKACSSKITSLAATDGGVLGLSTTACISSASFSSGSGISICSSFFLGSSSNARTGVASCTKPFST